MQNDRRLIPWLELASELEAFDNLMREHRLALASPSPAELTEILNTGADVALRMRRIATNRWTWYGWKRDALIGEASAKLHTLHRWIAEGFFFGCEDTDAGREMMIRLQHIENHFEQLAAA